MRLPHRVQVCRPVSRTNRPESPLICAVYKKRLCHSSNSSPADPFRFGVCGGFLSNTLTVFYWNESGDILACRFRFTSDFFYNSSLRRISTLRYLWWFQTLFPRGFMKQWWLNLKSVRSEVLFWFCVQGTKQLVHNRHHDTINSVFYVLLKKSILLAKRSICKYTFKCINFKLTKK